MTGHGLGFERRQLDHRPRVEDLPHHGGGVEYLALASRQALQSCRQQCADGRRNGHGAQVARHLPPIGPEHQEAVVDQHGEQLLDEQEGFPLHPDTTRSSASAGKPAPPRNSSTSSRDSVADRGLSNTLVTFSFPPPQVGWSSRNSGRARHNTTSDASRVQSTTSSMMARKAGSAQWRSSTTQMAGAEPARASR